MSKIRFSLNVFLNGFEGNSPRIKVQKSRCFPRNPWHRATVVLFCPGKNMKTGNS